MTMLPSEAIEVPTGRVWKCHGEGCPNHGVQTTKGHLRKWCSARCRKASYGDPCVDCGTRTIYGAETARIPEPRCQRCASAHFKRWDRETVIAAIQDWAALYGEPPAIADWNPTQCRDMNDPSRGERYLSGGDRWPSHRTVYNEWGSWNAALAAAGFEPRESKGSELNAARHRRTRQKEVAA